MGLLARLMGDDDPKLPVHQFQAALDEWERGAVTRAQVVAAFNLDAAEEADLDWLKGKFVAATNKEAFRKVVDSVLLLAERRVGYDTEAKVTSRISDASAGVNV